MLPAQQRRLPNTRGVHAWLNLHRASRAVALSCGTQRIEVLWRPTAWFSVQDTRYTAEVSRELTLHASCRYRNGEKDDGDNYATFTFSRVFGPDASQQEFYRATAAPMVRELMDSGLSSVMMAYGVSGAGKTYTMEVGLLLECQLNLSVIHT